MDVYIYMVIFLIQVMTTAEDYGFNVSSATFQKATVLLVVSYLLKLMSVPLCGQTENNIYTDKKKKRFWYTG